MKIGYITKIQFIHNEMNGNANIPLNQRAMICLERKLSEGLLFYAELFHEVAFHSSYNCEKLIKCSELLQWKKWEKVVHKHILRGLFKMNEQDFCNHMLNLLGIESITLLTVNNEEKVLTVSKVTQEMEETMVINQFVVDANKDITESDEFILKIEDGEDGEYVGYIRNVGGVNSILREVESKKVTFSFGDNEFVDDTKEHVTIMVENYNEDGSYISNNIIEFEKTDGVDIKSYLLKATYKIKNEEVSAYE